MTTENHPTQTLAEGDELKTRIAVLEAEYTALWASYLDARQQIAELRAAYNELKGAA